MPRQLSAGQCIRHALNSVRNNVAYAFRISWPWYAVLIAVNLVASFFVTPLQADAPQEPSGPEAVVLFALVLLSLVAFASIAVNWHRYILLDEVPRGSEIFRLDEKTWRYFGNILLISLILIVMMAVIVTPLLLIAVNTNALAFPSIIVMVIGLIFAAILFFRLSVKLPAVALGRTDFGFRQALSVTQGNNIPLFLIVLFEIVVGFAVLALLLLLTLALSSISATLAFIVSAVLQIVINWIFTIFSITILTSLYGFFVEGRDF
jgi:hypothetical protein